MVVGIRQKAVMMSVLLVLAPLAGRVARGQGEASPAGGASALDAAGRTWLNQDLHLTAGTLLSHRVAPGQHLLLCDEGFMLAVAGRQYTSKRAFVWIAPAETAGKAPGASQSPEGASKRAKQEIGGPRGYQVQVYLADRVVGRGPEQGPDSDLTETVLQRSRAVVLRMNVRGEVFVTAQKNDAGNPRKSPLYREGMEAFAQAGLDLPPAPALLVRSAAATQKNPAEPNLPAGSYTINWAPLTDVAPQIGEATSAQGGLIRTVIGRIYVWWEQPTGGKTPVSVLREVEADSLVVWQQAAGAKAQGTGASALQAQGVSDIYVTGNIVFRQGQYTIYADDLYYDLLNHRALAHNVVLKTFDPTRGVPIIVRASELRQLADNQFEGEDIILTTSEFWKPQLSLAAAQIRINDRTPEAGAEGVAPDSDYDAELKNVRFKYGDLTLLALPTVRADRERPDVPIRAIRTGYDNTFGASLETRWYLNRLLGLREPPGTKSTLSLDYYSNRGPGAGAEITYEQEDYFGSVLGYVIEDHGKDRLNRLQKDVDVPDDLRGRFRLQHRQYLPYGWQLTAEASYLSDQNFLEQFYRTEYNVGKEQETLLYLKRIEDNWGLAFLGKARINDFMDQVEELPSAEYHLTGQSLCDDLFTFYSDTQVSQYRYRFSPQNQVRTPDDYFYFTGTRNELDMPLSVARTKIVPFVAGTFGYDDGAGFHASLNDGPADAQDAVGWGEGGVRIAPQPFWAVYPEMESRLWDLHEMRHMIAPTITAVGYAASDTVAEQRDIVDLGINQRWQTKRGPALNPRTVDWLEWNTDFVWVDKSNAESAGPDLSTWNTPFIPMTDRFARTIPPLDRRATGLLGPRENYISNEAILRLTDDTSILGDNYFGMETGMVEQSDIGFSRLVWPDLSYYIGNRYLRRFNFGSGVRSSNALTFAITYILDPRYTLVFSNQYDYGAGANIATDVTLIRKYHRLNLALTFSVDGPLDDQRVVLALWPEGIPELGLGLQRTMQIGASDVYQ